MASSQSADDSRPASSPTFEIDILVVERNRNWDHDILVVKHAGITWRIRAPKDVYSSDPKQANSHVCCRWNTSGRERYLVIAE